MNDFIEEKSRMLYLVSNLSSLVSKQNLLSDSIFTLSSGSEIAGISFKDWKNTFSSQKIKTQANDQNKPQKLFLVEKIQPNLGFFGGSLTSKGTILSISEKPGLILTPDSSLIISKTRLFVGFKPNAKFADFAISGESQTYPESKNSHNFFIESGATQDKKFARIHSPTFYFRFLLTRDSVFPIIFFMRGDIRKKNSIAIIFHQKPDNPQNSFFISVYARDNKNKIFQFDAPGKLQTNRVHSMSVSYFRLLGLYSQLFVTIDDGRTFHGSSLFSECFIENTEEEIMFFPEDVELWKVFGKNGSNSENGEIRSGPGFGSLLLRYSHLNSGSGILHNSIFGQNPEFLSNCLGTCALNFSLDPLQNFPHSQTTNDLQTSSFWSRTCLSCNSVFPYFNWSSLGLSLRNPTFFPKQADLDLNQIGRKFCSNLQILTRFSTRLVCIFR